MFNRKKNILGSMSLRRFAKISGVTLVELLMAISVFVVGSISIWSLYFSSVDLHKQAIDEQKVAWVASSLITEIKQNKILLSSLKPIRKGIFEFLPEYPYDVDFHSFGNDTIGLVIKVYVQRHGQQNSYSFYSVIRNQLDKTIPSKK